MTLRTVPLPTNPGAPWDDFQWKPAKPPGDILDYGVDAAEWLRDAGRVLLDADVLDVRGGLVVLDRQLAGVPGSNSPSRVVLQLAGGKPDEAAGVTLLLRLDGGRVLTVSVALFIAPGLPAAATPYVPLSALMAGGQVLTIGGAPISP